MFQMCVLHLLLCHVHSAQFFFHRGVALRKAKPVCEDNAEPVRAGPFLAVQRGRILAMTRETFAV